MNHAGMVGGVGVFTRLRSAAIRLEKKGSRDEWQVGLGIFPGRDRRHFAERGGLDFKNCSLVGERERERE